MGKEPQKIGDVLPQLIRKMGLEKGIEQYKALNIWHQVVGREISAHTKPGWVNYGILWVIVDDPIWHQELEFLKQQIVEKLNQHLQIKLRGIKFIQNKFRQKRRKANF